MDPPPTGGRGDQAGRARVAIHTILHKRFYRPSSSLFPVIYLPLPQPQYLVPFLCSLCSRLASLSLLILASSIPRHCFGSFIPPSPLFFWLFWASLGPEKAPLSVFRYHLAPAPLFSGAEWPW